MANTSRKWYNFVLKKDNIAETSDLVLKSPISNNEQGNTDVKLCGNKTGHSLANRLKIAAIYDDIQAIINILSVNNSNKEIQRLLSKRDERGRPCIFYALESRSLNSFSCLLNYIQETKCVIAENGETVLHVAAKIGDVYILRNLLEKDFVAELVNNVENINARSPLHFAAMHNNLNIAKEFLQHGGNITGVDMTEKSPLHIAAYEGHTKMLDLFLKHEKGRLKALLFSEEYGGSQYRNILHVAVNSGNESSVEVCLQQDENIIRSCLSQEIKNNTHLIHDVCKYGMEKLLSRLVSMIGDLDLVLLNRKDERGHTPLHRAAINNHSSVVSYIGSLSKDFVNELTNYSQSALILATQLGYIEVVKELLKLKADFTIRDNSYKTVLHYAIAYPEILKILLKKNNVISSLINEITADDRYTPIHDAACKGSIESVEILIEYGADLNVFTKAHQSPLHCAVISQEPDVVKLILDHEPALINKTDANKQTPLHTAAECGDQEIVTCLLHRGAILLRNKDESTPLHIAARHGNVDVVKLLLDHDYSMIDMETRDKRTAMLEAAFHGKQDVLEYLLDNEATITKDYEFMNCFDWAIENGDQESAMMMMRHSRWREILEKSLHNPEVQMAKLVSKNMSDVAYQALCNSMISTGDPECEDYRVEYDFICLQGSAKEFNMKSAERKPYIAVKAMVENKSYKCLSHPVCMKYLKEKWRNNTWKYYTLDLFIYIVFLQFLNYYAFSIPSYKTTLLNKEGTTYNIPNTTLAIFNETNGIPTDDKRVLYKDNAYLKIAMVVCVIFSCYGCIKELFQLVVYKLQYFVDDMNYLECVLYISTLIFALPSNGSISVKEIYQWKACSMALLSAWFYLVMHFTQFSYFGVLIYTIRRMAVTLCKVMVLLVFFLVAFATAFAVIMNDRERFKNFGHAILSAIVMMMGEFDFKENFVENDISEFNTFKTLRLVLFVFFLLFVSIIIMNLLVALAVQDTSDEFKKKNKQIKLFYTVKMIINLERKMHKFRKFFCRNGNSFLKPAVDRPKHHDKNFGNMIWKYIFGFDFISTVLEKHKNNDVLEIKLKMVKQELKRMKKEVKVKDELITKMNNDKDLRKNIRDEFEMMKKELIKTMLDIETERSQESQGHS